MNQELAKQISKEAWNLMKENPMLTYGQAYDKAKKLYNERIENNEKILDNTNLR